MIVTPGAPGAHGRVEVKIGSGGDWGWWRLEQRLVEIGGELYGNWKIYFLNSII